VLVIPLSLELLVLEPQLFVFEPDQLFVPPIPPVELLLLLLAPELLPLFFMPLSLFRPEPEEPFPLLL